MENNKLTQELLHSLKRIAEGIEHANKLEEAAQKRNAKFDKLQEKLTALELKSLKEKRQAGEVAAYLRNKLEE